MKNLAMGLALVFAASSAPAANLVCELQNESSSSPVREAQLTVADYDLEQDTYFATMQTAQGPNQVELAVTNLDPVKEGTNPEKTLFARMERENPRGSGNIVVNIQVDVMPGGSFAALGLVIDGGPLPPQTLSGLCLLQ